MAGAGGGGGGAGPGMSKGSGQPSPPPSNFPATSDITSRGRPDNATRPPPALPPPIGQANPSPSGTRLAVVRAEGTRIYERGEIWTTLDAEIGRRSCTRWGPGRPAAVAPLVPDL